MKIGVDISQIAYGNTGVANYLSNLVREMVKNDEHEFVLFFSSLRRDLPKEFEKQIERTNVRVKKFKFPPIILDLLWNKLHIIPIEKFIGQIDFLITSDWTEPPVKKAKKATILYDLLIYKSPGEMHKRILKTQKSKLKWAKKETSVFFCISESTLNDAQKILNLDKEKLKVIYPGI